MNDFFSDHGHLFAAATLRYTLPPYVADADTQMEKVASLRDECFANPVERLFPIHDRAHVFASSVYAAKQASLDKDLVVWGEIQKRAEVFGILDDVKKVYDYVSGLELKGSRKEARASAPFIINIGTPAVSKIMGEGLDAFNKAASRFVELVDEMPVSLIRPAAVELVKAAEANGAEPDISLLKFAGVGLNEGETISEQINLRIGLVPDPLEKRAAVEESKSIKTAEDLLAFDRKRGLDNFYGERLDRPHHVFYSGVTEQKQASFSPAEKLAKLFFDHDPKAIAAVSASVGEDRCAEMQKSGSLDLNETEVKLTLQYLR